MSCSVHCLATACNIFEDSYAAAQCRGLYFAVTGECQALLACAQVTVLIYWVFGVLQRVQEVQMPCRLLSLFGGIACRTSLSLHLPHPALPGWESYGEVPVTFAFG